MEIHINKQTYKRTHTHTHNHKHTLSHPHPHTLTPHTKLHITHTKQIFTIPKHINMTHFTQHNVETFHTTLIQRHFSQFDVKLHNTFFSPQVNNQRSHFTHGEGFNYRLKIRKKKKYGRYKSAKLVSFYARTCKKIIKAYFVGVKN